MSFQPVPGRALMSGRQNTGLIRGAPKHLIERSGIPLPHDTFEIEKNTIHSTGHDGEMTDRAFFRFLKLQRRGGIWFRL